VLFIESETKLVFENIIYFDTQSVKRNIKFNHFLRENIFVYCTVQCGYTSCLVKQY